MKQTKIWWSDINSRNSYFWQFGNCIVRCLGESVILYGYILITTQPAMIKYLNLYSCTSSWISELSNSKLLKVFLQPGLTKNHMHSLDSLYISTPFSRWTWVSRCWLKQRMMEVVVTTGAISRAKLQSNHHHQKTNTMFLLCDTDMHSAYLLWKRGRLAGWVAVRHTPVLCLNS